MSDNRSPLVAIVLETQEEQLDRLVLDVMNDKINIGEALAEAVAAERERMRMAIQVRINELDGPPGEDITANATVRIEELETLLASTVNV
jgi:hypothetical protein